MRTLSCQDSSIRTAPKPNMMNSPRPSDTTPINNYTSTTVPIFNARTSSGLYSSTAPTSMDTSTASTISTNNSTRTSTSSTAAMTNNYAAASSTDTSNPNFSSPPTAASISTSSPNNTNSNSTELEPCHSLLMEVAQSLGTYTYTHHTGTGTGTASGTSSRSTSRSSRSMDRSNSNSSNASISMTKSKKTYNSSSRTSISRTSTVREEAELLLNFRATVLSPSDANIDMNMDTDMNLEKTRSATEGSNQGQELVDLLPPRSSMKRFVSLESNSNSNSSPVPSNNTSSNFKEGEGQDGAISESFSFESKKPEDNSSSDNCTTIDTSTTSTSASSIGSLVSSEELNSVLDSSARSKSPSRSRSSSNSTLTAASSIDAPTSTSIDISNDMASASAAMFQMTCPCLSLQSHYAYAPSAVPVSLLSNTATSSSLSNTSTSPSSLFARPLTYLTPHSHSPHTSSSSLSNTLKTELKQVASSLADNILHSFLTAIQWRSKSWVKSLNSILKNRYHTLATTAIQCNKTSKSYESHMNSIRDTLKKSHEARVISALARASDCIVVHDVRTTFYVLEQVPVKPKAKVPSASASGDTTMELSHMLTLDTRCSVSTSTHEKINVSFKTPGVLTGSYSTSSTSTTPVLRNVTIHLDTDALAQSMDDNSRMVVKAAAKEYMVGCPKDICTIYDTVVPSKVEMNEGAVKMGIRRRRSLGEVQVQDCDSREELESKSIGMSMSVDSNSKDTYTPPAPALALASKSTSMDTNMNMEVDDSYDSSDDRPDSQYQSYFQRSPSTDSHVHVPVPASKSLSQSPKKTKTKLPKKRSHKAKVPKIKARHGPHGNSHVHGPFVTPIARHFNVESNMNVHVDRAACVKDRINARPRLPLPLDPKHTIIRNSVGTGGVEGTTAAVSNGSTSTSSSTTSYVKRHHNTRKHTFLNPRRGIGRVSPSTGTGTTTTTATGTTTSTAQPGVGISTTVCDPFASPTPTQDTDTDTDTDTHMVTLFGEHVHHQRLAPPSLVSPMPVVQVQVESGPKIPVFLEPPL
mmetsp:Transcript_665/g.1014  ORF Transcript_665/g.1014 Transcript_665/m.1014 type:complete len:1033 (+) Transcript_665:355-3453(+)